MAKKPTTPKTPATPPTAAKPTIIESANKPKVTSAAAPLTIETAVAKPVRAVKATASKKKTATRAAPARSNGTISQDEIALRAYFISEKRRAQGLPGDEHQDWLEAERQISAESGKRTRSRKG